MARHLKNPPPYPPLDKILADPLLDFSSLGIADIVHLSIDRVFKYHFTPNYRKIEANNSQ